MIEIRHLGKPCDDLSKIHENLSDWKVLSKHRNPMIAEKELGRLYKQMTHRCGGTDNWDDHYIAVQNGEIVLLINGCVLRL
jgi:hypothetical protein